MVRRSTCFLHSILLVIAADPTSARAQEIQLGLQAATSTDSGPTVTEFPRGSETPSNASMPPAEQPPIETASASRPSVPLSAPLAQPVTGASPPATARVEPGLQEQLTAAPPPVATESATREPPPSTWHFGGYGELILSSQFYHPDLKLDDSSYRDTHLDLARFSLFIGHDIARRISFLSEIEFEHGGTGVAREVEWEEFGEYETEVEKGGEIVLEQAYLEGRPSDWLTLRAGHLLVPVGMTTQYHLPTLFSSTRRPESEARLIPSIWHENGVEAMLRIADFTVRAQAITGLDSTGFSSSRWIAGGNQRAFERPLVNDVATVLAVDYLGISNAVLGASVYSSGSNRNRPKRDLFDVGGRVTIGELHARYQQGPLKLRGLVMLGHLQNAAAITRANASLSSELGASRTPVASAAYAAWAEAAYDLLSLFRGVEQHHLDLFTRYDAYDAMWKAGAEFDNPLLQTQTVTSGLNYFPHPRVVIKAEYVSRWLNQNQDWARRQSEANAALGFVL